MVANKYAVSSILNGKLSIVVAHDTFSNHLEPRNTFDLRNDVPADVVVLMVLDVLTQPRLFGGGQFPLHTLR